MILLNLKAVIMDTQIHRSIEKVGEERGIDFDP
jgi:hypothetical protein